MAVDARMAHHSGIGRYIRSLGAALARQAAAVELTLLCPPPGPGFADPLPGARKLPYSAPIYSLREQLEGSWRCRSLAGSSDVFHFPHYNAPWWLPRRSVVTIHDLTHFELPGLFPPARVRLARLALGRAVRGAARLIAVSQATLESLERGFPGVGERTTVIHHGVDRVFRRVDPNAVETLRAREGLARYFLFVGNLKPHKNLEVVLRAFGRIREERSNVDLVIVADRVATPDRSIRVVGPQSDESLAAWYAGAEALVLPSLNEGFGLTALEAAACGTPVLAADIPATREVLGDAALLLDPDDDGAWAEAMTRMIDEPGAARDLGRRGRDRSAAFTWDAAAERTLEVYRAVAGERR